MLDAWYHPYMGIIRDARTSLQEATDACVSAGRDIGTVVGNASRTLGWVAAAAVAAVMVSIVSIIISVTSVKRG